MVMNLVPYPFFPTLFSKLGSEEKAIT
ncbi:protein of unknown function [Candidatus Promineifilum breve]|uniref:Uncharacterized protein n=1 Tax=Candidatus Promineifilum breve TaxID=1806508 RepID=A0A170PHJ8_9CHLR|nr:protein of unknown function [Candidatus Promineifilum breve]